jgi:hypothetical protein
MFSKVNAIVLELNHSLACGGDRLGGSISRPYSRDGG